MYLWKQKDNSTLLPDAGVLIVTEAREIESLAVKWISTQNMANLTSTPIAYESCFTDRLFMKEFK